MAYTWNIPAIYMVYNHVVIYQVNDQVLINGLVPYKSHYWIDISYAMHMTGTEQIHLLRLGHMPGI
jgi:hypothetical protein